MAEVESNEGTQEPTDGAAEFAKELQDSYVDPDPDGDIAAAEDAAVDDQPPVDTEEEEAPVAEQQASEEETETPDVQETKTYKVPDDSLYGDLRGRKATALELEEAGLLEKLLGREHQELHHVKLYQEANEKIKALEALVNERAPEQPAQPEAPPMSVSEHADAVTRSYVPHLEQLANEGAFEPDFIRAYPKVGAQIENRFQSAAMLGGGLVHQMTKVVERLNQISEYVGMQQDTTARSDAQVALTGRLNSIAESMPALKDESVQGRFQNWVADPENKLMDVVGETPIDELTDDQLRGAFAAYVAVTGDGIKKRPQPREGANIAGGGGASRGSSTASSQNKTGPQQLEAELAASGWRG
jgi:hypothetical protein